MPRLTILILYWWSNVAWNRASERWQGKKVKLRRIFMDKFAEKLADFANFTEKQLIFVVVFRANFTRMGVFNERLNSILWSFLSPQLLKGVTIASGGVLPNIHPELLKKRKGGKLVAPEELKPKKPRVSTAPKQKAGTSGKKMPASPAKKTPEKSQASGKGKKKGVSTVFKTESTKKLSNFNFQWTKTSYQNNLKHNYFIAFFFTFFKGYKDVIIVICNLTPKKFSYGSLRKWMSNFTKSHLVTHAIFRILTVFSQFLWNLTLIFSDSHEKCSLLLL